jgi:xanthine dehydrogenase iron-sulfur cluster and FAD-binding subunit A
LALVDRDSQGKPTYRAFNSCIALVPMFAGREIVTVEGLAHCGADKKQLHPVQAVMVEHYGSQCGYCTPGFVVSMFEAYYRDGCKEPWQVSDQLCNLCRCTGYRPIRDVTAASAQRSPAADDYLPVACCQCLRRALIMGSARILPPHFAARPVHVARHASDGPAGGRCDRDRR